MNIFQKSLIFCLFLSIWHSPTYAFINQLVVCKTHENKTIYLLGDIHLYDLRNPGPTLIQIEQNQKIAVLSAFQYLHEKFPGTVRVIIEGAQEKYLTNYRNRILSNHLLHQEFVVNKDLLFIQLSLEASKIINESNVHSNVHFDNSRITGSCALRWLLDYNDTIDQIGAQIREYASQGHVASITQLKDFVHAAIKEVLDRLVSPEISQETFAKVLATNSMKLKATNVEGVTTYACHLVNELFKHAQLTMTQLKQEFDEFTKIRAKLVSAGIQNIPHITQPEAFANPYFANKTLWEYFRFYANLHLLKDVIWPYYLATLDPLFEIRVLDILFELLNQETAQHIFLICGSDHINPIKQCLLSQGCKIQRDELSNCKIQLQTTVTDNSFSANSPLEPSIITAAICESTGTLQQAEKARNECPVCEKAASKRCSQCKAVYYCSAACQRADWSKHKQTCTKK